MPAPQIADKTVTDAATALLMAAMKALGDWLAGRAAIEVEDHTLPGGTRRIRSVRFKTDPER